MDPTGELKEQDRQGIGSVGPIPRLYREWSEDGKDQMLHHFAASDQDSARLKFAASDKVAYKKSFLTNQGTGRLALALDIAHAVAAASAHFNLLFIFYSLLLFLFSFLVARVKEERGYKSIARDKRVFKDSVYTLL